jgi:Tfp pilus assembly protein PilE
MKGYTLIEVLVTTIIVFVLSLIAAAVVLFVKGCNRVSDTGLKPALEEVWHGKNNSR